MKHILSLLRRSLLMMFCCSSAPELFNSNEGMFGSSTAGNWLGSVIAMAMMIALAVISLVRGLSARSTLRSTTA